MISWLWPGTSSSGKNARPSCGCTPSISKKFAVMWKAWTFCGLPSPVRLTSSQAYAPIWAKDCASLRRSRYVAGATECMSMVCRGRDSTSATILSAFSNGAGCSRNASATLNIAVFAPMPNASATTHTSVVSLCLKSIRTPKRMSCQIEFIERPSCRALLCADAGFLGLFDDPSVKQVNGALGEVCIALVVGHHADRRAVAMQIAQQFHDGFAVLRVQVSSRLVGHQDERVADQCAGHGNTLLLTARELRGIVPQSVRHSHALQCVLHFLLALRCARSAVG